MPGLKRKPTDTHSHNSKRQRHNPPSIDSAITQGKSRLTKALKLARGFERQKLGRRLRISLREKSPYEVTRINSETAALKILDPDNLASFSLYKRLSKIKSLSSHPAFPAYISDSLASAAEPQDKAHANVTARLLNTRAVKEQLNASITLVYQALGVSEPESSKRTGPPQANENLQVTGEVHPNDNIDGPTTNGAVVSEPDPGSDNDLSPDFNDFSSSNNNDEVDHNAKDTEEDTAASEDDAIELHANTAHSSSDEAPSPNQNPRRSRTKPAAASSLSSFLPSLATGYISGSETASDLDDLTPKRNRPGQRARQARWERKFGGRANHIRKGQNTRDRDEGWDLRRGASDRTFGRDGKKRWDGSVSGNSHERSGSGQQAGRDNQRSSRQDRPREEPMANRGQKSGTRTSKAAKDAPLHPSWEAAKKMKEKAVPLMAAFQGKKVVFD